MKTRGHSLVTRRQEHKKTALASGMAWIRAPTQCLRNLFGSTLSVCVGSISWLASRRITRGLPSSSRATGSHLCLEERIILPHIATPRMKIPFHHISYKTKKNFACSLSAIKETTSIYQNQKKGYCERARG